MNYGFDFDKLKKEYGFKLLEEWQSTIEAGYTADDLDNCNVFSSPVYDQENFYYCAYKGSILLLYSGILSSILVYRKKNNGSVVYATNCQSYSLDTDATFLNMPFVPLPALMICRSVPVIKGNKLYLVSGWITNIGPQLFCIDKRNGNLIYSIAYNLPTAPLIYIENKKMLKHFFSMINH